MKSRGMYLGIHIKYNTLPLFKFQSYFKLEIKLLTNFMDQDCTLINTLRKRTGAYIID